VRGYTLLTVARPATVEEIEAAVKALPEGEALALLARLERELRFARKEPQVASQQRVPPVGILRASGPPPTDAEVDQIIFEERLSRYLR
jgi:hypothetical protein